MNIFVDLDGTICTQEGTDYEKAQPYLSALKKLRKMEYNGHKIYIWTARGTSSGKDFKELTERQLKDWHVPYTGIVYGKPAFDLYICDKARNANDWRCGAIDEELFGKRG